MLPYKAPELKQSAIKTPKIRPIPSVELMQTLQSICEDTRNSYDRKNHMLIINDSQQFENALTNKHGRSLKSFEKQLKMLGFKSKKYKELVRQQERSNGNAEFFEAKVYKWIGKKELLINQELSYFQKNLKERKTDIEDTRNRVRENRQLIDRRLQQIILGLMVSGNSSQARQKLNLVINQVRKLVNNSQLQMRENINKMSNILGNQLELYRLLIYKEEKDIKKGNNEGQWNEDHYPIGSVQQFNSYNDEGSEQDSPKQMNINQNNVPEAIPQQNDSSEVEDVAESSKSAVSIKMEKKNENENS